MQIFERYRLQIWLGAIVAPAIISIVLFLRHIETRKLYMMCKPGHEVADCFRGDGLEFLFTGTLGYLHKGYPSLLVICVAGLLAIEALIAIGKFVRK